MAGVKRKAPSSSAANADDDAKKKKNETSLIPPIDSDDVIQNRLRMGHGIKGGTRGSLTRCAGLVVNFVKQQQQLDKSTTDTAAAAAAAVSRDKMIREFQHLQLEMTKWILTTSRNEQELADVQQRITALEQETSREKEQVQQKRAELHQQLHVTACEREYDALAKLAANRHPISRKVLQQQLQKCQDTITATQLELQKRKAQTAVRQGQFQLLMQCILDLKQSLDEPLDDIKVVTTAAAAGAAAADDENDKDENEDSASEGQAMEVDQREEAGKTKKIDDEDLYDDL